MQKNPTKFIKKMLVFLLIPTAFLFLFSSQAKAVVGLTVGNGSLNLGATENLIYGNIGTASSPTSNYILFQKNGSSLFNVDSSGNLLTTGSIRTNNQFISTVANGTAPFLVSSNTKVNSLNADFLDNIDGASYYKDNDVVMNTNPFGGRRFYISNINDAMFRADSRWVVTGNYYNASDDSLVGAISDNSLSYLFDGNYETGLSIPAGQYAVVNINFSSEPGGQYPSYPYGYFYLSHYYTSYSASATVRTYSNYAPHGVGWHEYTFSDFLRSGTAQLITRARNDVYGISQAEFKIYAPSSSSASITAIDWQLDRPGSSEMPLLDKYKINNLYSSLNIKRGTSTKISLNNNGGAYFVGSVGIGTTTPGTRLSVVGDGTYSIDAGNNRIGNVSAPVNATDAVNRSYLDSAIANATSSISTLWGGSVGGNVWSLNSGNVGIGTTDPGAYKLKVVGNMAVTGTFQTQTGSDFAEEFSVSSDLEPGTVVIMDNNGYKSVKSSLSAYDNTVVGIVSDNPSIIAGKVNSEKKVVVAMVGVVSVKVSNVNGDIKKGDLLTSSNISGYAMKSTVFKPGTVIGKALEDLKVKKGVIKVLVNLQ